jgi:phage terminase small subunit
MTPKQELFIKEYQKDRNATAAAKRAGYSDKTAYAIANELLKKPEIQNALESDLTARAERLTLTADDVIRDLITIKERCMNGKPFDARGAIKALELIGKNLGMFANKLQVEENKEFIVSWQNEALTPESLTDGSYDVSKLSEPEQQQLRELLMKIR